MAVQRSPITGRFVATPRTGRKKTCTKCGQSKYLGQFYRSKDVRNHPDGYDCRCKECRREEKRLAYAKRKQPDHLRPNERGQAMLHANGKVTLYWPPMTQQDFIRRFPYEKNDDLALDFTCSPRTITRRARDLGLEKDHDWLHAVWRKAAKQAHRINKLPSTPKADLTNFLAAAKEHQFQPGHPPTQTAEQFSASMKRVWARRTSAQRHAIALKAWVTRRAKQQQNITQ